MKSKSTSAGKLENRIPARGEAPSQPNETRRIPVYIVVPPRLLLLDIAGPLEVLRQANRVQDAVRFEVEYVGPQPSLQTSIGVTLSGIEPLPRELETGSWVVLAGDVEQVMQCGGKTDSARSADDAEAEKAIVDWLKSSIRPDHKVITICAGVRPAARNSSDDTQCN